MSLPAGYTIRFPNQGGPPGAYGSVAFTEKHWKVLQKDMIPKSRAQLHVAMQAWCAQGPRNLPETRFRFEGSYESGGKRIRLEAFKGWSVRLYGSVSQVDGRPVFLVTGFDDAKKDREADLDILKAAAKAAHKLIHRG